MCMFEALPAAWRAMGRCSLPLPAPLCAATCLKATPNTVPTPACPATVPTRREAPEPLRVTRPGDIWH